MNKIQLKKQRSQRKSSPYIFSSISILSLAFSSSRLKNLQASFQSVAYSPQDLHLRKNRYLKCQRNPSPSKINIWKCCNTLWLRIHLYVVSLLDRSTIQKSKCGITAFLKKQSDFEIPRTILVITLKVWTRSYNFSVWSFFQCTHHAVKKINSLKWPDRLKGIYTSKPCISPIVSVIFIVISWA